MEMAMANVTRISRPDVVALIEEAAGQLMGGNKIELVAMAVRRLLKETAREGSLFGSHPGSVRICRGADLTKPVLDDPMDAEAGRAFPR
jgi:hypothetical protein